MSLVRTLLAGVVTVLLGLSPAARGQVPSEYTLDTVVEKLRRWSIEAKGYSEYRWKKSWEALSASMIGSTVALEGIEVVASEVKVVDGKARYACPVQQTDEVAQSYVPADGIERVLARRCKVTVCGWVATSIASTSNVDYPCTGNEIPLGRSSSSFDGLGPLRGVQIVLNDSSDRMAMELTGKTRISVVGRITAVAATPEPSLVVEVTAWRPLATPARMR